MKRLALLSLLLLPSASIAGERAGQQPDQGSEKRPESRTESPRVRSSADVVLFNLDVVVTDSNGNAVQGLTADDFVVLHDRKKATITNFREERGGPASPGPAAPAGAPGALGAPVAATPASPAAAPPAPAEAGAPRLRRHLAFFFDRLDLPDPEENRAFFGSMRELLRKSLEGGDDAMVVAWNGVSQKVVPFTTDLGLLEKGIDEAARLASRLGTEQTEIDSLAFGNAADARAGVAPNPSMDQRLYATRAFRDVKAKAGVMRAMISILAGMDGRKALVLVTRRFSRYAGREFGGEGFDTKSVRDAVIEAANAAGVTLYTVDARPHETGLPSTTTSRDLNPSFKGLPAGTATRMANAVNEAENLSEMALQTGGAMAPIEDVAGISARVSRDLESSYSLGYPPPRGAARTAAVSVSVKGRKVDVRTRSTFVEKSPEEQMSERVLSHLFRPDPRSTIPVSARGKVTPGKDGTYRATLAIRIPIKALVLLPTANGASGAFAVFAAAVGPDGSLSEVGRQRQPFQIPRADLERAKASHFTYDLTLELSTPNARIGIGVWDETGQEAGFVVADVS